MLVGVIGGWRVELSQIVSTFQRYDLLCMTAVILSAKRPWGRQKKKRKKIIINFLNSGTFWIKNSNGWGFAGGGSQIKVQSKHMTFCFDVWSEEMRGLATSGHTSDFCHCVISPLRSHQCQMIIAERACMRVCLRVYPHIMCCWLRF